MFTKILRENLERLRIPIIIAYKLCPQTGKFYENQRGIYGNSTEKTSKKPRSSVIIPYKFYPRGSTFTTLLREFYETLRPILGIIPGVMSHHPGTYDNFTINLRPPPPRKFRLLGLILYRRSPDQAAPIHGAGSSFTKTGGRRISCKSS